MGKAQETEEHRMVAYCRFCGQSRMLDTDIAITEKQAEEEATRRCTCEKAREYTRITESKEQVSLQIQMQYENDHQSVGQVLIDAIDPIAEGKIKSVTVKAGEDTVITAKISRTKDGIRATREDKAVSVAEA